jgi:hypothetical protein
MSRLWKQSKIIVILKPGKPSDDPKSFRPISLLCTTFKLMERILLARLTPLFESVLPKEQAGFQKGLKTGALFIDVTSA